MTEDGPKTCTEDRGGFEERTIAFVDILGFRDLVERMNNEPCLFSVVKTALERVRLKEKYVKGLLRASIPEDALEMNSFSDSVVISARGDGHFGVLASCSSLAAVLMQQRILCRGAVVQGLIYHSEGIAFGEGLIRAYEGETRAAVYPRIVVSDEVQRLAQGQYERDLLAQDSDGLWFVDFRPVLRSNLRFQASDAAKGEAENLLAQERAEERGMAEIREWVNESLSEPRGKRKLGRAAKYGWLAAKLDAGGASSGGSGKTGPMREGP